MITLRSGGYDGATEELIMPDPRIPVIRRQLADARQRLADAEEQFAEAEKTFSSAERRLAAADRRVQRAEEAWEHTCQARDEARRDRYQARQQRDRAAQRVRRMRLRTEDLARRAGDGLAELPVRPERIRPSPERAVSLSIASGHFAQLGAHCQRLDICSHQQQKVNRARWGSLLMPGVRIWPSESQLVQALEAEVPLWAPPLVWPAACLNVLFRRATPHVPRLDRVLISDLERVLRQQTAWMQRVSRELGGVVAASVTNVIADTVVGWARTALPSLQERPGCRKSLGMQAWDPHGVYSEVHLPVVTAGKIVGKPCDLIVIRSDAPDLVVEIDRENNKNSAAKLMIARDAGATSTWIRWAGGRTTAVPGTHLIDLVRETRDLGVTTATTPRLYEVERDEVVISEFSEIKIAFATGDKEGRGQPSAAQIRHKAAKWLAYKMTCHEDPQKPQDGRLADGLVVTGHQRIGDLRPDRIPGELVRYEVSYIKVPGTVVPVRPLVVAPLSGC